MEPLNLIGSIMGLGFIAGIRLYSTILALGLGIRFGYLHLSPGMEHLQVLTHPAVLIAAGVAYLLEFFADKIPWVDSFWDSFHTFIRPIGAALLAATALGPMDPVLRITAIILCGGVALSSHSSKAAARLAVNHSPEPFSNIGLSLAEDLFTPVAVWLSLKHPLFTFAVTSVFVALFLWLAPGLFRLTRIPVHTLAALLAKWFGLRASRSIEPPAGPAALHQLATAMCEMPVRYATHIHSAPPCIPCAATKSVRGLKNSSGYLFFTSDELVFLTRRNFRFRTWRVRLADIQGAELKRGLIMDRLILETPAARITFYVYARAAPVVRTENIRATAH